MNVNLHVSGKIERFVESLVTDGFAASKTEAVRLALVRYYEERTDSGKDVSEEFNRQSMEAVWNNPKDEKASEFYSRRYLRGKKA